MNLLAVDTSASYLSVSVSAQNKIWHREIEAVTRHSELLMDSIDSLIKEASLNARDLNGILCMGGPGSFTGLRIGFCAAKGLALALGIPFAHIPTLECIASSIAQPACPVLPVIMARKNAFFCAMFSGLNNEGAERSIPLLERLCPDMDASLPEITALIEGRAQKTLLTGPGAEILYNTLPQRLIGQIELSVMNRGYSRELIEIAKINKILDNDNTFGFFEGPEYIRKTDAEAALSAACK